MPDRWTFQQLDGCWYIAGRECTICLQPRPEYCNRGNWLATIDARGELSIDLDGADGWPRYYFDLARARLELEAWLVNRGQMPEGEIYRRDAEGAEDARDITSIFAWIGRLPDGKEGIPVVSYPDTHFQLVYDGLIDQKTADFIRYLASAFVRRHSISLVLARFSCRGDIDSISAPQAQFDAMVAGRAGAAPPDPAPPPVPDDRAFDVRTSTVPTSCCGSCGFEMDHATNLTEGAKPRPGALSICLRCQAVHQFNDDMTQRLMSNEELQALPPEMRAEIGRLSAAMRTLRERRAS